MEELAAVCMLLADEVDRLRSGIKGAEGTPPGAGPAGLQQAEASLSSFWKRRRLPGYDSDVSGRCRGMCVCACACVCVRFRVDVRRCTCSHVFFLCVLSLKWYCPCPTALSRPVL